MAEAVGTVLAVVGVLGQLFDGCVKSYNFLATAANLDVDSQRLWCKVRIEEMRLVVWGRDWGVAEGKLDKHLDSTRNPQLRALAMQILEELHTTVTDFHKLRDKYGLREEGGGGGGGGNLDVGTRGKASRKSPSPSRSSSWKASVDQGQNGNGSSRGSATGRDRSWRKDLGLRFKWVIGDKEKFEDLLRDLRDFNDGLERLFPPSHLPSFQRAWTNQLLESAQRDLAQLSLLGEAATGVYPQLTASASLKKLRINLDAKPQASFKPTFALRVPRSALNIPSAGDVDAEKSVAANTNSKTTANATVAGMIPHNRSQAHHEKAGDVLIEWVDYDREAVDERVAHVRRLDDLARMMHSASDCHPDLHSIDCLGYTDDTARNRYGLIYKAPASSFSNLHALISSSDLKTPDLDDRIRLAQTLAVALWSLHSLDWLHKSLCSFNVLFFPSAFTTAAHSSTAAAALVPDIGRPYLAGFDASRPELDTALSVVSRNPSIDNLNRHPAAVRGLAHCKSFDIYSLGLVLLEIGLWKVLQSYYKPHYSAERWRDKVLLAGLVPGLGSKVGRRYSKVVDMCLRAGEDMSSTEAAKLMEQVVVDLEAIRV